MDTDNLELHTRECRKHIATRKQNDQNAECLPVLFDVSDFKFNTSKILISKTSNIPHLKKNCLNNLS